jgi:lysozyme
VNYSPACLDLVKSSEGCILSIYEDSGGVLTGGFGHTGHHLTFGERITQQQADAWLAADLANAASDVSRLAPKRTQNQFDALTDFVFNLGASALAGSTLLRLHNAGDYAEAAKQFSEWVFCKGKVLPGLVHRRAAEARLYLGDAI